jgi:hypothetical protein
VVQAAEHHTPEQQVPDLEQAEAETSRRGPKVAVAAIGAAWVTAAVIAVTLLRPELAVMKKMAERAATGAPIFTPADFARPPLRPSGGTASVPAHWWRHTDRTGFEVNLPDGWTETYRSAYQARFTSAAWPGAAIVIAYTATPEPDQYANWEQLAAWKAKADSGYYQVGLQRVSYRGWNSADWEFTDVVNGVETHFLDHGFIPVAGQQAYAIELIAPSDRWDAAKAAYWDELLASFSPAATLYPGDSAGVNGLTPVGRPTAGGPAQPPASSPTGNGASGYPPTATPTPSPTSLPTPTPTSGPTSVPTGTPTSVPTSLPPSLPTSLPTSLLPTDLPTSLPASLPSL